jgi:predicted TIM-barrel fold metal-dependent hydrolase
LKARHIPIREAWLARRREAPVDPAMPIVDAHHHLWDKPGSPYLLDEIVADMTSGHNVVATVFVEGKEGYLTDGEPQLRPLGETRLVAGIAEAGVERTGGRLRVAAGIVGFVDLMLGEAAGALLDRHDEAGRGRFRGVRNSTAWHPDPEARGSVLNHPPGGLYAPEMRRGLLELQRRGLVFDAWMYHTQLGDLADLVYAMPDLTVVINHIGGPIGVGPYQGRRQEVCEDWRHFMRKLSKYPNVSVKLGGLGMLMGGFDFQDRVEPPSSDELAAAWGPYMRELIEAFGPQRCMFESNFPVDKGTTSYGVLWNAFKKISAGYSSAQRHALFFATANRIYRLGL